MEDQPITSVEEEVAVGPLEEEDPSVEDPSVAGPLVE